MLCINPFFLGVLEYTPHVLPSPSHRRYESTKAPALAYTLHICDAFTILAAGAGQVLFFIDSFERAFDRAGILSPVPIFSLPGREDRTDEGDEKEGERTGKEGTRRWREEWRERAPRSRTAVI